MTMHTVPDIPIAPNAMTRLNPISYHLLITGAGAMHDGKDIMLRLTFANAGTGHDHRDGHQPPVRRQQLLPELTCPARAGGQVTPAALSPAESGKRQP